jgi:hypothetical protein
MKNSTGNGPSRVAILCPGDRELRRTATPAKSRFSMVFDALNRLGAHTELAVYHDDFCEEVRQQIMKADAVLVWFNPVEGGRDRSVLDEMLREVAASGVFVSAHPDIILKLGTKEVLYRTREIGWGCDTHLYRSLDQMRRELPARLADGKARVLKQYRGQSGDGVWKIEVATAGVPSPESLVRVQHAKRGSPEETIALSDFCGRCAQYFAGDGRMVDQAYQERLPEGMTRCYLVHDKVAGFGHQAVNMLYPAPAGKSAAEAPLPGPRLYHPATQPEFQALRTILEIEWMPAARRLLEIETTDLPVLWDCDFLLGPKTASGEDTYVLCEINVSSVAPFPDSAVNLIAQAVLARARALRGENELGGFHPVD